MVKEILKIENLQLDIDGRGIFKGLNLTVKEGERLVLFGPNGAGKSSLIYAILGFPEYRIKSGRIIFKGKDIAAMTVNQRVGLGLGASFQLPPPIRGIKLNEMLKICDNSITSKKIKSMSRGMKMEEFLDRDVNLGFSGGESKRSELLQLLAQQPELALFDEPDSGVDVENVGLVGDTINSFLKSRTGIVITHQGYILQFIKATRGCVLYNGEIICYGDPVKILHAIKKKGYAGCAACKKRMHQE